MRLDGRSERLSEQEYLLLQQLIAFKEQQLTGETLKETIDLPANAPDRVIEKMMIQLIRKTNALFPAFPLIRRQSRNVWLYSEVAPKKKKAGVS